MKPQNHQALQDWERWQIGQRVRVNQPAEVGHNMTGEIVAYSPLVDKYRVRFVIDGLPADRWVRTGHLVLLP